MNTLQDQSRDRHDDVAARRLPDLSTEAAPRYDDRPSDAPEVRPIMRFRQGNLHEEWYIAARSRDVTNDRPTAVTVMEERIVLYRTSDGEAVALLDRCLHRNAQLSRGKVFGNCIGCPYHGWTYDRRGSVVFVPSEGPKVDGTQAEAPPDRPRLRVERFPVREQQGFVWVYLGTPERAVDKDPFRFPESGDGWKGYGMVTRFDGDVTDLAENFMDVPHTAFVHAGWFRPSTQPTRRTRAVVERTASSVLVEYLGKDTLGAAVRWLMRLDTDRMVHTDRFFMPNCTRVDYLFGTSKGIIITSQVTPISPGKSVVFTAIHYRMGLLNPIVRAWFPWYTRRVIQQDVEIMQVQTENLARFGRRRFNSTSADVIHRSIEALREHALRGGDGDPPPPEKREIVFWM